MYSPPTVKIQIFEGCHRSDVYTAANCPFTLEIIIPVTFDLQYTPVAVTLKSSILLTVLNILNVLNIEEHTPFWVVI